MLERSARHPATVAELGERGRHVEERRPVRERLRERVGLALGDLDALILSQPLEREREHFAVGVERLGLGFDLGLELVVALEQARRFLNAEEPLELACGSPRSSRSACRNSQTSPSVARP